MSELVTIEGKLRSETGKNFCRRLRAQGKIPANILVGSKSQLIELEAKLLSKAWKGSDRKFNLSLDGVTKVVKIQELQINPVKRAPLHADLMYV